MNTKNIPYKTNYICFNMKDKYERIGRVKIYPSVIENASKILVDNFIDYFKKGGDIDNLTPDNLFDVINKNG